MLGYAICERRESQAKAELNLLQASGKAEGESPWPPTVALSSLASVSSDPAAAGVEVITPRWLCPTQRLLLLPLT